MPEAEKETKMEKERRNGKEVRKKISIEGMPIPSILFSVLHLLINHHHEVLIQMPVFEEKNGVLRDSVA